MFFCTTDFTDEHRFLNYIFKISHPDGKYFICENLCNLWCKKTQTKTIQNMENKNIWGKILNILITVLTAIATTFGVSSCMSLVQ